MDDLHAQIARVEKLVAAGETEGAVKELFDLIVSCAKAKDFNTAEKLRDRLMEVNSLALTEIIQSAEIIEAEKTASIDKKHQKIWEDLYNALSPEEGNALYQSLEKINLDPDQTILAQSKLNDKLFFIDSGSLKITFQRDHLLEFVKGIGPGETVGQDTFFAISLCTTSVTTSSGVQTKFLPRTALDKIEASYPGFSNKLESFCRKKEGIPLQEILQGKAVERRQHKRYAFSAKLTTQLLSSDGKPLSSPFAGFIDDISHGGLSFSIKCSKQSTARMLLGRPAQLTIEASDPKGSGKSQYICQIVCAKHHLFNDYSVHVRFAKSLTSKQLVDLGVAV